MLNHKWVLGAAAAIAGATLLVAQAAEMPHMNVKLGLWEVQVVPQVSGDYPSLSEEQLAKMSPEQRAKMQAAMAAAMGDMNKPRINKECMTAEKLQRGFGHEEDEAGKCKTTVLTNSGSEFASRRVCSSAEGNSDTSLKVTAKGSDHVIGTVQSQMTRGTKGMNFNATMEGKWLGTDCGAVKP